MKTNKRHGQAGFSMIEMLIVMAIIMVISAMALPNIMNAVYVMRMRSALTELTGLMQQTRMRSVRDGKNYQVLSTTMQGRLAFYADFTQGGGFNGNDFVVMMPLGVAVSGVPASITGLPASTYTNGLPSFNTRGLPCTWNGINDCQFLSGGNPTSFAYYMTSDRGDQLAITVLPSGKVKGWIWTGASFQ